MLQAGFQEESEGRREVSGADLARMPGVSTIADPHMGIVINV